MVSQAGCLSIHSSRRISIIISLLIHANRSSSIYIAGVTKSILGKCHLTLFDLNSHFVQCRPVAEAASRSIERFRALTIPSVWSSCGDRSHLSSLRSTCVRGSNITYSQVLLIWFFPIPFSIGLGYPCDGGTVCAQNLSIEREAASATGRHCTPHSLTGSK